MIKKLATLLVLLMLTTFFVPSIAMAAKPTEQIVRAAPTVELVGYDISYPQCGKRLPTDFYFGIVGVNGGNAATVNPCLADQLVWANRAKFGSAQSRMQLYVNTANPGELISQISTWPSSVFDTYGNTPVNPYGLCAGANDKACSWLYGWNRSIYTESVAKAAAENKGIVFVTANYKWWLDVETMNTWQSGSADALLRNVAAIEGFGAYYEAKGATIGLYSTAVQWTTITGNNIRTESNLNGLPNWRPSGSSLNNAKANCKVAPLTSGGYISLTQYIVKGLDNNHSCI